jgi:hypothetical protein
MQKLENCVGIAGPLGKGLAKFGKTEEGGLGGEDLPFPGGVHVRKGVAPGFLEELGVADPGSQAFDE